MRRRLITAALCAVMLAAFAAAPAGAAKSKTKRLTVKLQQFSIADCTVAPDKVRFLVGFEAKVKYKNVKPPSRITVSYKITDPATGQVRVGENVTLRPKDYLGFGTPTGYTTGSTVQFDASFNYKSTVDGKRKSATNSYSITIPTNDELAAAGVKSCV